MTDPAIAAVSITITLSGLRAFGATRGFTNHEMVDTVGLVHMGGRVYDPTIGRFLSADPQRPGPLQPAELNRYAYVLNNPLSDTDPRQLRCSGVGLDNAHVRNIGRVRLLAQEAASIDRALLPQGGPGRRRSGQEGPPQPHRPRRNTDRRVRVYDAGRLRGDLGCTVARLGRRVSGAWDGQGQPV